VESIGKWGGEGAFNREVVGEKEGESQGEGAPAPDPHPAQ